MQIVASEMQAANSEGQAISSEVQTINSEVQTISSEALLTHQQAHNSSLYLLLDMAAQPEMKEALYQAGDSPDIRLLFVATPYQSIAEISPYLITLTPDMVALLEQVKAAQSGVVLESSLEPDALQQQLGSLLTAHSDSYGGEVFFRFFSVAALSALLKESVLQESALQENTAGWRLPGCLSVALPDYQARQWRQTKYWQQTEQQQQTKYRQQTKQKTSRGESMWRLTSQLETRMELERLAYWLGMHSEWHTHSDEAICQAADTLCCLMQQHTLTHSEFITWSQWLANHTHLLTTPQWAALLNAGHSHQALLSEAHLLARTTTEEPIYD